jgi:Galactose oxidase, central domain
MQSRVIIRSCPGFLATLLLAACGGGGGGAASSAAPAPTVTLTSSASSIVSGSSVTLTWSSANATSCTASGGWAGTKATSGSELVGPLNANASYGLRCSGAGGTANQTASVNVTAPAGLHITSGAPPNGTVGVYYNHGTGATCAPSGTHCYPCFIGGSTRSCGSGWVYQGSFRFGAASGVPPYTWTATGVPPGLSVSADGTFLFSQSCCRPQAAGTYTVVVTVTDSGSPAAQVSATYVILISPPPPPIIRTSPAPIAGAVNLPYYGYAFQVATGGQAPFRWNESGTLPTGLVLSDDGTLSGTPTVLGSFPITVTVKDALGQSASPETFTIDILAHGFKATGSMATVRIEHTATLLGNGKVLVAGGRSLETGLVTATAELFDPGSGTFAPTGSMTNARSRHTATLLSNGKVLVTGGVDSNESSSEGFASAELFDPSSGTFTPTGSMRSVRLDHRATLLDNGTVLVTGGSDAEFQPVARAELFNVAQGTFTPTGSMAAARDLHTATLLTDGKVLVIGGSGRGPSLATAELYNPATSTFTTTGSMAAARSSHTATLLSNGNVLVTGGFTSDVVETAELFVPAEGSFTLTGNMAMARGRQTATLLNDGTILVIGGYDGIASAELFDPIEGRFTPAGSMATARDGHTATLLEDGSVLVTGGASSATLSTAEIYQ